MRYGISEFIAVVETGSFTAAAERLGTSKSRLSQVISQLETELGVALLQRTTRKVRTTDTGELFYKQCSQGMQIIQNAVNDAQEDQLTMTGLIRINAIGGELGESWLAPVLIEFLSQHPAIKIELDFSSHQIDVFEAQYDLVIRMGHLPDSTLIARPLQTITSIVCASPDFASRHKLAEHPNDLSTLPAVLGTLEHLTFRQHDQTVEWHGKSILKCRSGRIMKAAALSGLAFTRIPTVYIEKELQNGQLINLLPDWTLAPSPLQLIYPQHRFRLKRIKVLADYLVKSLADKPIKLT